MTGNIISTSNNKITVSNITVSKITIGSKITTSNDTGPGPTGQWARAQGPLGPTRPFGPGAWGRVSLFLVKIIERCVLVVKLIK